MVSEAVINGIGVGIEAGVKGVGAIASTGSDGFIILSIIIVLGIIGLMLYSGYRIVQSLNSKLERYEGRVIKAEKRLNTQEINIKEANITIKKLENREKECLSKLEKTSTELNETKDELKKLVDIMSYKINE